MSAHGMDVENLERYVLEPRRYFESVPADRFPHVVAHAAALTAFEHEGGDRWLLGVDVLLEGIAAVAARRAAG